MTQQIWKDYYVDLSAHLTDNACDYEIRISSDVIFAGRALADPDGNCLVRVNDICAGWLTSEMPDTSSLAFNADASCVDFALYVGGTKVEDITLYRDWSYDRNWEPYTGGVSSDPIKTVIDKDMPLLYSVLKSASVSVNVRGTTTTVSATGSGVIAVPAQNATGTIVIDGLTYTLEDSCKRYALYYVNAYGGWDCLLMDNGVESRAYERSTYRTDYDNGVQTNVGEHDWRNGVTRSWLLKTGVLTDAQAAKMHHVIGTVQAYLYDIAEGTMLPVIVTDNECTEKRYALGKRKVEYTVSVRLAQSELRR